MSVMGSKKKVWIGGGCVELYPFFLGFSLIFFTFDSHSKKFGFGWVGRLSSIQFFGF